MFHSHRHNQFEKYHQAKDALTKAPSILLDLEEWLTSCLEHLVRDNWAEIESDYNEASYLHPFWQNYPPDDRGRKPKGDQYPWIEVGEHAVGGKLPRLLANDFAVRDTGLPTGPDQRFVLSSATIEEMTGGLTDTVFLFVDIKSVGPRDDAPHVVMSHNQVSGDGIWLKEEDGVRNTVITALGERARHDFHSSIPPLYVLSNGIVAPVINVVVKPVYNMHSISESDIKTGQPLDRITLACIPNGLLLHCNPKYLNDYPRLFFPGKDDKKKKALKMRARVSFEVLTSIGSWRVKHVSE